MFSHFIGDFTVRIFDLDTSDSFLLPMKLANKTADEMASIAKKEEKKTPIIAKHKSILQRDSDSDEELAEDVDEHLAITSTTVAPKSMEVFTCLAYCLDNQTLCAGTNEGNLYIWKRNTSFAVANKPTENGLDSLEQSWHLYNIATVRGAIKHCSWGVCDVSMPCVLVNCIANVYILKEQPLLTAYSPNIWITQKSATQLYVEHSTKFSTILRSDISAITGLCLNDRNLAITNHKSVAIYKIPRVDEFLAVRGANAAIKMMHTFHDTDCSQIFIFDETLVVLGYEKVRLYSFGGIVLKEINFNDNEGEFSSPQ